MTNPLTLKSLPLFPLNTVLFPGGLLPLRVFEVRYLDMVRRCQHTGAPFGVVALRQGAEVRRAGNPPEQFYEIGTMAQIDKLDTPQTGLISLLCTGQGRFHIDQPQLLPHGLWVADVTMLPVDRPTAVPSDLESSSSALAQLLRNLHQRHLDEFIHQPDDEQAFRDCGWVANRWCELLPLPLAVKQQLLELDSPLLRLELATDLLEQANISF